MTDGDVNNSIGSREDSHSIGERLEKGPVESEDFLIDSSILKLRFHRGRRGSASRGRGRRESRQKCGWGGHSFRQRGDRNRQWGYRCRKLGLVKVVVTFLHGHRKEHSSEHGV